MSVPGGVAPPPGGRGEARPLRLRRLDQPARPHRLLAEEFFAGPITPAGGPSPLAHRWASGLAAAALSLTLVLSLVLLALLGGGLDPGGQFSQAPLLAEGRGDPVRATPRQEPRGTQPAPTEAAQVAPQAPSAPPAPAPVIEEPVAGEGTEEASRGGGTGPAGGGAGGGDGGGGGGGGGGAEVVPPIETGGVVGVDQGTIPPVVDATDQDAEDEPHGSEGQAQDEEEPQPPPQELPPCTVNEEEENGSADEGLDSADEDGDEEDADQDDSDHGDYSDDSGDEDEDPEENGSD